MSDNHEVDYTGNIMVCHVPDRVPTVVYVKKKSKQKEGEPQSYTVETLNSGIISWPSAEHLKPFNYEDYKRDFWLEKSQEAERDSKRFKKYHAEV